MLHLWHIQPGLKRTTKAAARPDSSSIQLVIISYTGKFKLRDSVYVWMQLEMEFGGASSCLHFLDGFLDNFGKLFSIQLKFSICFNTLLSSSKNVIKWYETDQTDPVEDLKPSPTLNLAV